MNPFVNGLAIESNLKNIFDLERLPANVERFHYSKTNKNIKQKNPSKRGSIKR